MSFSLWVQQNLQALTLNTCHVSKILYRSFGFFCMEITYKKSHYLCLFNDLLIFVDSWLRSGPLEWQHELLCIGKYSWPIVSSAFVFVKKRECTCTNTTTCEEGKQNLRPECSITYLLILASYTYIFFPYSLLKMYILRERSHNIFSLADGPKCELLWQYPRTIPKTSRAESRIA